MKRLVFMLMAGLFIFLNQAIGAEKKTTYGSELEELKKRVEDLEKRMKDTEVVDELGHRFHPIHSIYGLKIGGGLTITAQGVDYRNNRSAGAISADIALESPVGKDGRAIAVLDFQRGPGLQNLPALLTSPNGNTTGTNADIESFSNNTSHLHITQFYYEHNVASNLVASIGQLDITGYFDANEFANNERTQFFANLFVNNPTIEFGGSADFYSPGIRLTYGPFEAMDITAGVFEGNGDYTDMFDKPFYMAEINFKLMPADSEGNYRIYYWGRHGRDYLTNTANPDDTTLLNAGNSGVGLSIDQVITSGAGVWLRAGVQSEKVAQFDRHISGGVNINGKAFNRPNDVIGIGYGATFIGKDYKDYQKRSSANFEPGIEHYMELYYNMAVSDAAQSAGFHISPGIQYVTNPGGNANASKLFIYGLRLQTFF
ncbi:MAG: carbohydrate porin [Deltaproteobacteria bacterium]|nr:carbohydrate porin [Deltaproteobacteria bacterium]